ncbi:MAG: chromate efflux transporter [Deltaproteobacteria bacterium]|nr:chromate efflux transporter [Deltaproteobacteria bacterium]
MADTNQKRQILREISLYFLRLGCVGFGGPLALVAQMEADLGDRWIPKAQFAQIFAAIKTLPGPVAFQTAVFLGYQRGLLVQAPRVGAALAALGLVVPSALLMTFLALTYQTWALWKWTQSATIGLQAAALGLILASVIPLAKGLSLTGNQVGAEQMERIARILFVAFGFLITLIRPSLEPFAILFCGLLSLAPAKGKIFSISLIAAATTPILVPAGMIGLSASEVHIELFVTSLKAGAMVFGSGLAIVPLLGSEFVDKLQWMTHAEFLEALTFGQVTPGPVVITATYIGAKAGGVLGAITATIGIFLVPYIHMTTWFPHFWRRVSASHQWRRFSFGAISCVVGAIVASVIKLLEPAALLAMDLDLQSPLANRHLISLTIWFLFPAISFVLTYKKILPAWLTILGGGATAWLLLLLPK